MGDESDAGTQAPPVGSARGEAFNWLIDPHRESVPMAPPIETVPPPPAVAPRRHRRRTRSATSPVDWVAIVLAFLAPPLGILVGVGAVIAGLRLRGYATSVAKAAIGIGAVLTLVLGVALVVGTKVNADRAAHAAIVSSSNAYCTMLKSKPATLTSDTFGWPTPGDTIPTSITTMSGYASFWSALAMRAPTGIRADTQRIATTANSIVSAVQSTQTLNDAGNIAQLQNVVATSHISAWVSNYCT